MKHQEIFDKVAAIIQEIRGGNLEITPELSLYDDLGADSVELMEFIIAIEDTFGIEISDEDADKLTDVASFVELVAEKE